MNKAKLLDCKNRLCHIHGSGGWVKRRPWKEWGMVQQRLKTELPASCYARWIDPVVAYSGIENTQDDPRNMVSLVVRKASDVSGVRRHCGNAVKDALLAVLGEGTAYEYVVACTSTHPAWGGDKVEHLGRLYPYLWQG